MLFDSRLAGHRAELFDISGYAEGVDLCQFKSMAITPAEVEEVGSAV